MKLALLVFGVVCYFCICVFGYNNGVALTPPMGWNSWNHFSCNPHTEVTQDVIKATAQAMVSSGMKAVGYEYINIDDCVVNKTRDANGKLQPDPRVLLLIDGFPVLSAYIHSLGLKFGVYTDTSLKTCAGYPGMRGSVDVDAQTFLEWGVDYVKVDGCFSPVPDMPAIYANISKFLNETGRPMVLSCSWPTYANTGYNRPGKKPPWPISYEEVASVCNLWRYWTDVRDQWSSWLEILDYQENSTLARFAGPGRYVILTLSVGNGHQTSDEYRSMFSLWSMIAAPLLAGNDLRNMTKDTIDILTAHEVIAVDQDPLGIQGKRTVKNGHLEIWTRPLYGGALAVALFNRNVTATITAYWGDIGLNENETVFVRDLWRLEDLGYFAGSYSAEVGEHATVLVKLAAPSMCSKSFFFDSKTCSDTACIQGCDLCDNANSCIQCSNNTLFYEGQCLVDCPAYTIKQGTTCVEIENLEYLDDSENSGEIAGVYSLFGLGMVALVLIGVIYWRKRQESRRI